MPLYRHRSQRWVTPPPGLIKVGHVCNGGNLENDDPKGRSLLPYTLNIERWRRVDVGRVIGNVNISPDNMSDLGVRHAKNTLTS